MYSFSFPIQMLHIIILLGIYIPCTECKGVPSINIVYNNPQLHFYFLRLLGNNVRPLVSLHGHLQATACLCPVLN